ncbi:hypothetical protein AA958_18945 [Streptomyces sp. CNQ-509]|uniref:hypothetical protein n=1 Tax=Streptomyces sp. CNQ-509 TaxID=444103 RepID=UPI00062DEC86|nr:hypothetical protein [Streptomyces sp. CNQ-509]AKH83926.1 hypothetical protein AA958_18945 [Streptomyces sp. CNQ-509]
MATRSFIARPTDTGYAGVYVHYDGYPSARLPLLLTSCRYRFHGDVEALAGYLIDDLPDSAYGWVELGAGLLRGAPEELRHALTGGVEYPSRTLDNVIDTGGAPAAGRLVTPSTTGGLDWGYVLHPHGIEVINLHTEDRHRGPIVDWRTDPRTAFSDFHRLWKPGRPPAVRTRPASPPVATTPAGPHPAGQRTSRP